MIKSMNMFSRSEFEKRTVYKMIRMYCKDNHNTKKGLCDDCKILYEYAAKKYDKCPFGNKKPVCSKCQIHCYKKEKREEIRLVMRYAGPRMIFRHPIYAIVYLFNKLTRKAPKSIAKNKIKNQIKEISI